MNGALAHDLYRRYVNPDYVGLLEALRFGRCYVRAEGTRLWDDTGREYTDFLAGYGVHNLGHADPAVLAALRQALTVQAPSMLNVDAPPAAGLLAKRLCELTRPDLCRTAFANSGAEAVEIALKAVRLATGRQTVLHCHGAFHGLTSGAASLLGDERMRRHLCLGATATHAVPFNDAAALEQACEAKRPAAFFVEPIEAEGGIRVPSAQYLRTVRRTCSRHGVLLVIDEIQTGLGRTGALFATDLDVVKPDVLLLGKALSGGVVPVAAAMMTVEVWTRAFSGPERCLLNSSTFAGNHLAMTAALATLDVLESNRLAAAARVQGELLLARLQELARRHPTAIEARGRGLLLGLELRVPTGFSMRLVPSWARRGFYAHVVAAELLHRHGLLTQPCALASDVLRIEPPLIIKPDETERLCGALDATLSHLSSGRAAVLQAAKGWG